MNALADLKWIIIIACIISFMLWWTDAPESTHADNMFQAREVMRRCSLSDGYPEITTIWNVPEGQQGRHPIGYEVICSE